RDPARVRRGRADRRLHAVPGVLQGRPATGGDRHRFHRDLLPYLLLERVRLRGAPHLRDRADRAALHSDDHRCRRARLAGGGGRRDAVPAAGDDLHHPAAQAPAARHHLRRGAQMSGFFRGLLRLRRGPWEIVATILIGFDIFMLMQPFALWAFTYSFFVTLLGTVMFIVVSHFPE